MLGLGLRRAGHVDVHAILFPVVIAVEGGLDPEFLVDPLRRILECRDHLGLSVQEDGASFRGLRAEGWNGNEQQCDEQTTATGHDRSLNKMAGMGWRSRHKV